MYIMDLHLLGTLQDQVLDGQMAWITFAEFEITFKVSSNPEIYFKLKKAVSLEIGKNL